MKLRRAGDRSLQLLIFNEEFLVSASQQLALITSLPFVPHRPSLLPIEWFSEAFGLVPESWATMAADTEKMVELDHLEEVKVVTRFP